MKYLKRTTLFAVPVLALTAFFSGMPDRAEAGPDPYIGDIIQAGYNFCPRGWASASGQLLPISQNTALFSLIGTTYGGDGRTTFGLPDLRGRAAMGQGRGPGLTPRTQGQLTGAEGRSLLPDQMPSHTHAVNANNLDGDKPGPGAKLLAAAPPSGSGSETIYSDQPSTVLMAPEMISNTGQGLQFDIQDPYLVMIYCIALQGQYPSRP